MLAEESPDEIWKMMIGTTVFQLSDGLRSDIKFRASLSKQEMTILSSIRLFGRTEYGDPFEENISTSVESYIGEPSWKNGVKAEEIVCITESGYERVASFPCEEELPVLQSL